MNPPRAPARFPPNPANPAPPAPPHFAFIRPGVCCESGIAKSRGGGTVANGDGSFPPCKTSPYKSPTGLKHPSCVRGNHPDGVCAWRARGGSDDAGAATAAAAAAGAGVFHSPPAAAPPPPPPPQTCESYPTDASLSTVSGTSSVDVFASAPPGAESSSARVLMLSSPPPPPFASCASSSSNPIGDSPSDGSAARVGGGGAARGVRSSSSSSVQHGGNSVSGTTHCDPRAELRLRLGLEERRARRRVRAAANAREILHLLLLMRRAVVVLLLLVLAVRLRQRANERARSRVARALADDARERRARGEEPARRRVVRVRRRRLVHGSRRHDAPSPVHERELARVRVLPDVRRRHRAPRRSASARGLYLFIAGVVIARGARSNVCR